MQNDQNLDTDKEVHVYDGIIEQNNPMPSWWVWLFICCVGFAMIYFLHYTSGSGGTLLEEYHIALDKFQAEFNKGNNDLESVTENDLAALANNEISLQEGASIFAAKCAMCHGEKLQGKIGPNLTDHFWITGNGTRKAIMHTIINGSMTKGMPAWQGVLKPTEIKNITVYIYSHIGSVPEGAKAPEGNEFKN